MVGSRVDGLVCGGGGRQSQKTQKWFAAGGGAQFFVLEGLPLDKAVNFDMAAAAPV